MTRAILLALLLPGCGRPDRIPLDARVSVSSSFTAEQTESVVLAIDGWKGATGGRFHPTLVMADDCWACQLRVEPGALAEGKSGRADVAVNDTAVLTLDAAHAKASADKWHVDETLAFQDIAMHELGHCLGLEEHESGTLMRAYGFDPATIATVDARTLQRFAANY